VTQREYSPCRLILVLVLVLILVVILVVIHVELADAARGLLWKACRAREKLRCQLIPRGHVGGSRRLAGTEGGRASDVACRMVGWNSRISRGFGGWSGAGQA
jgi:hypothetical protein